MKIRFYLGFLSGLLLVTADPIAAVAGLFGHQHTTGNENMAMIYGQEGEQYPISGTGGIRVTGGHHSFFIASSVRSPIEIDGSALAAKRFSPFNENADFTGSANCVYFVSDSALCTLPTAVGVAGAEIAICNANNGVTITYQTTNGESVLGVNPSSPITNSTVGKVDRFISDGIRWYRE